jgi:hypothetical protein
MLQLIRAALGSELLDHIYDPEPSSFTFTVAGSVHLNCLVASNMDGIHAVPADQLLRCPVGTGDTPETMPGYVAHRGDRVTQFGCYDHGIRVTWDLGVAEARILLTGAPEVVTAICYLIHLAGTST